MPWRSRMLCFLFRRKLSREGNAADGDIQTGDIEEEKREVNLVASDGASKLGELIHTSSSLLSLSPAETNSGRVPLSAGRQHLPDELPASLLSAFNPSFLLPFPPSRLPSCSPARHFPHIARRILRHMLPHTGSGRWRMAEHRRIPQALQWLASKKTE